eukprot:MONOS_2283.1-p1 / transcript=MONOS_2283.1 / gene=MONOS_2283 / organism=Monocercomonoides_exilis_PA203 / gene_product=unspecified product / transcript_product=unspecified product / location=Mono_scaffold00046:73825-77073(+) / protein_length=1083 / sequence_SO=supercontig / SO=protein_coding / is_pseudo=false
MLQTIDIEEEEDKPSAQNRRQSFVENKKENQKNISNNAIEETTSQKDDEFKKEKDKDKRRTDFNHNGKEEKRGFRPSDSFVSTVHTASSPLRFPDRKQIQETEEPKELPTSLEELGKEKDDEDAPRTTARMPSARRSYSIQSPSLTPKKKSFFDSSLSRSNSFTSFSNSLLESFQHMSMPSSGSSVLPPRFPFSSSFANGECSSSYPPPSSALLQPGDDLTDELNRWVLFLQHAPTQWQTMTLSAFTAAWAAEVKKMEEGMKKEEERREEKRVQREKVIGDIKVEDDKKKSEEQKLQEGKEKENETQPFPQTEQNIHIESAIVQHSNPFKENSSNANESSQPPSSALSETSTITASPFSSFTSFASPQAQKPPIPAKSMEIDKEQTQYPDELPISKDAQSTNAHPIQVSDCAPKTLNEEVVEQSPGSTSFSAKPIIGDAEQRQFNNVSFNQQTSFPNEATVAPKNQISSVGKEEEEEEEEEEEWEEGDEEEEEEEEEQPAKENLPNPFQLPQLPLSPFLQAPRKLSSTTIDPLSQFLNLPNSVTAGQTQNSNDSIPAASDMQPKSPRPRSPSSASASASSSSSSSSSPSTFASAPAPTPTLAVTSALFPASTLTSAHNAPNVPEENSTSSFTQHRSPSLTLSVPPIEIPPPKFEQPISTEAVPARKEPQNPQLIKATTSPVPSLNFSNLSERAVASALTPSNAAASFSSSTRPTNNQNDYKDQQNKVPELLLDSKYHKKISVKAQIEEEKKRREREEAKKARELQRKNSSGSKEYDSVDDNYEDSSLNRTRDDDSIPPLASERTIRSLKKEIREAKQSRTSPQKGDSSVLSTHRTHYSSATSLTRSSSTSSRFGQQKRDVRRGSDSALGLGGRSSSFYSGKDTGRTTQRSRSTASGRSSIEPKNRFEKDDVMERLAKPRRFYHLSPPRLAKPSQAESSAAPSISSSVAQRAFDSNRKISNATSSASSKSDATGGFERLNEARQAPQYQAPSTRSNTFPTNSFSSQPSHFTTSFGYPPQPSLSFLSPQIIQAQNGPSFTNLTPPLSSFAASRPPPASAYSTSMFSQPQLTKTLSYPSTQGTSH